MKGIASIKERILEDAHQKVDEIQKSAQEKADGIRVQADKQAQRILENAKNDAQYECEEHKRRLITIAQLDLKKQALETKQDMIEKTFENVLDKLCKLPLDQYKAVITDMLLDVCDGKEQVVFSNIDKERLGKSFINTVNNKLIQEGKNGKLSISDEVHSFKGGFILKGEGVEINSTFEFVLRTVRDDIESEVAGILFA